jgi:hypothetical protein
MDIIAIKVGNRPLQTTKLFVMIAISLSRGESIMRQPITPAALQPNPMHMDEKFMLQIKNSRNQPFLYVYLSGISLLSM